MTKYEIMATELMREHIMLCNAIRFATEMHEGQVRKYTGEAYITHPIAVADKVEEYMDDDDFTDEEIMTAMIIAVLHDTVEDTNATHEDILERFGEEVAAGVWYLTKTESFVGNRETRKKLCEARLELAPWLIRLIKTCDMHHNSTSIEEHDPKFWVTFQDETKSLLAVMGMTSIYKDL